MPAASSNMVARVAATQATLARFDKVPFVWGKADCVRLAAFHLKGMGHRVALSKGGAYSSALGARKALKAAGFDSLESALAGQGLPEIAPAAAIVGDLVGLEGEGGWVALTVALGNGRVLGFRAASDGGPWVCGVLQPHAMLKGWRVQPCQPL